MPKKAAKRILCGTSSQRGPRSSRSPSGSATASTSAARSGASGTATPAEVKAKLIALDERWTDVRFWQAIAKYGSRWTGGYLLASVDLKRDAQGAVTRMPEDQRVFGRILARTFGISAIVTLWCLLLGYPLAYWLSTLSARRANVLMILVLVPFWTSILVRIAAWIVLARRARPRS